MSDETGGEYIGNGTHGRIIRIEEKLKIVMIGIEELKEWTVGHQREEFGYHDNVGRHMTETVRILAQLTDGRAENSRRITALEVDVLALRSSVLAGFDSLRWRVAVAVGVSAVCSVVVLPLLGYLSHMLIAHVTAVNGLHP